MRLSIAATALLAIAVHAAPALAQDIFTSPRPTFSPAPDYPEALKNAGIAGVVMVQAHINAAGAVTEARVLSGPAQLQDSALQAVKTWKFEATMIGGKATPVVSTIRMVFGNPPPPTAPPLPSPTPSPGLVTSNTSATPPSALPLPAPRPLGINATTDGDKVIGSLKWEIREEATGKILATGDGPVTLKDVWINEFPNPSRRQTPKAIKLTNEFVIEMAEFPTNNLTDKSGFGITGRNTTINSFSWEWFTVQDSRHATKLQEGGELGIELKQVNGDWEITKTEFTSDISLRVTRMGIDPPGSAPYWRINISKGSNITWPSIASGKVIPN